MECMTALLQDIPVVEKSILSTIMHGKNKSTCKCVIKKKKNGNLNTPQADFLNLCFSHFAYSLWA